MWTAQTTLTRYLTPAERQQVEALFSAIIPGDTAAGAPGAKDVGAAEFLSRLLALGEETYYEIPRWRATYRQGLAALDAASHARVGRSVTALTEAEVTELLGALAKGELPGFPAGFDQKAFFALLRGHCIEGCFADPRWGGNRSGAMWKWFGYQQEGA